MGTEDDSSGGSTAGQTAGAGAGAGQTAGAGAGAAESMVSAALLREAQTEASTLRGRVEELESSVQTLTGERDDARTSNRRMQVRLATGIDDDTIADMAHSRYTAAVADVAEDKRPDLGKWWTDTAADDEARGKMPKALSVYMTESGSKGGEGGAGGGQHRQPGTPGNRNRRDAKPGDTGKLSVEDYRAMSPDDRAAVRSAFYRSARRRVR